MVSLIAQGRPTDRRGRPYPRRRTRPWVILVALLGIVTLTIWIMALTRSGHDTVAMNCPPPTSSPGGPQPAALGQHKSPEMLSDVQPAALSATKVRVFNANGERGQAAHVAGELSDLGYASASDVQVGNDPVYVDQNMACSSQIRFGESGHNAAAALQLVAPCSELIEDKRADDTVDLALGTVFIDVKPNADASEVLRTLKDAASGSKPAPLDPGLLSAARNAKC